MEIIVENYLLFMMVMFVVSGMFYFVYKFIIEKKQLEKNNLAIKLRKKYKQEVKEKTLEEKTSKKDKYLLELFVPQLIKSMKFLEKHHNMDIFDGRELDTLYKFKDDWSGLNQRFINTKLERERTSILLLIQRYLSDILGYSTAIENGYYEIIKKQDVLEKQAEKILKEHEKILNIIEQIHILKR